MKREELNWYCPNDVNPVHMVYFKVSADEVMDALEDRINELENKIPKWISVNDRLPNEKEQNELLWIGWLRMDNTIKYMSEASFDCETKQFYTENNWGNKDYFLEPSVWMVVPQPTPRTDDSSVTEKEKREVEQ